MAAEDCHEYLDEVSETLVDCTCVCVEYGVKRGKAWFMEWGVCGVCDECTECGEWMAVCEVRTECGVIGEVCEVFGVCCEEECDE